MRRIDMLIGRRTERRRGVATACVSDIRAEAASHEIDISVIGSLATGRFAVHSDIDLLVHGETTPQRRALVERIVAMRLRGTGIPYDLIFASDLPAERLEEFLDDSIPAPGLREARRETRSR